MKSTDLLDNPRTLLEEDQEENQKEDPEITAEKQRHNYMRIQGTTLLRLPESIYDSLYRSDSLPPKEKQKTTPLNDETFDKLPMEIIWEICEYLEPVSILNLENTCTNLYDSCQDKEIWRKVCYHYQILLACDEFYVFNYLANHHIFASQKDLNAINNGDDKWVSNDKVDESLYIYEGNNNGNNELVVLTTPESREIYIENLQDPKKTLLSQMKKLKKAMIKKEKIKHRIARRREENLRFDRYFESLWFINGWYPSCILMGIFVTLLLINLVVIEKITLTHRFWIFAPLVLPTLLFCATLILQGFYKPRFYKLFIIIGVFVYIGILNLPFYFIVVKVSDWVTWSWLKVFIPLLIFSGLVIVGALIGLIVSLFQRPRDVFVVILTSIYFALFSAFFIFLIFLGLKLDHKINWNWGYVFCPFFVLSALPSIVSWIYGFFSQSNYCIFLWAGLFFIVGTVTIWITPLLFTLWLETDRIPTFTRVLIPIYIITAGYPLAGVGGFILWIIGFFNKDFVRNFF
ncbi:dactylin [Anaeramoeba flamelloides]|uniref:Dactylin n=1 Tax=Anaeramoeba flamelloides TaxID=1746091 RepID=A0ABQ8Y1M5_9EUKA|nr:dactylin [Anaeramoeba flamelloides]